MELIEQDFLVKNNYIKACELYYLKDLIPSNILFKHITWNKLLILSINYLKTLRYNDKKNIKNVCISIYKYLTKELNLILNNKFRRFIDEEYLEWIKLMNYNYNYNLVINKIIIFTQKYIDKPSQIIDHSIKSNELPSTNPTVLLKLESYERMLMNLVKN